MHSKGVCESVKIYLHTFVAALFDDPLGSTSETIILLGTREAKELIA